MMSYSRVSKSSKHLLPVSPEINLTIFVYKYDLVDTTAKVLVTVFVLCFVLRCPLLCVPLRLSLIQALSH